MIQLRAAMTTVCLLAVAALAGSPVEAAKKYKYGRYGAASNNGQETGFFLTAEGLSTNPRNTDAVLASTEPGSAIVPSWSDDFAGRLGLGFQWANGNRIYGSAWRYSTDVRTTGAAGTQATGAFLHTAIGPPLPVAGGTQAQTFDFTIEIEATTGDIAWGRTQQLSPSFDLDWSVGLRYAKYEELYDGSYGGLANSTYAAMKSIESEMVGLRVAAAGRWRFTKSFFLRGGIGVSLLDGEITATSSLTEVGATTPATFSVFKDDGRSGTIFEGDAVIGWNNAGDRVRVWLGWEQSSWNDVPTDFLRNFPGTTAPLRDRDNVTFSAYKLGLYFRF